MGGRVAAGGRWSLFGCTMAPGFTYGDYEHGDAADLTARYPAEAARIMALCRP
jgi:predicted cupin superfamily sugar epimerase